ncbi:PaaI family thioesterase [candidate division TA06 bacterium]|uniref:PaaI family thioesterase n=1 Tax=candidate division TA06 bacterium TaxID=2250710 RepID=A0A933I9G7_UNCT6|nr:PaaI family thioesterase [candidate division TA06 bacterium]
MDNNKNLIDDKGCFACGRKNPDGLQLKFNYPQPGTCRAAFVPEQKYQGWQGILHGGIVSTLLDEALAHAVGGSEGGGGASGAVTAELTVRFKRPVKIGQEVILKGQVIQDKGRVVEAYSEITSRQGDILAFASGKLVRPPK